MRALALLLILSACVTSRPAKLATVQGSVRAVEPRGADGAVVMLDTDGGEVEIRVSDSGRVCEARPWAEAGLNPRGRSLSRTLSIGDQIEVSGIVASRGPQTVLRVCDKHSHELSRLWAAGAIPAGPGVFRGTFLAGFEAFYFTPEGRPSDELWSLRPNEELDRYLSDVSEGVCEWGMPYLTLDIEVEGVASTEGSFGHLGGLTREIAVTRVREIALDPRGLESPDCP